MEIISNIVDGYINGNPFSGTLEAGNEDYQQKFKDSILDQKKTYPPPVPVITFHQNGQVIPLLTLKSLSLFQGKQKSKKTTLLALMVAAFIKGAYTSDQDEEEEEFLKAAIEGDVLFFDNEQGESYAARSMHTILNIAGMMTSPRLIFCDLRRYPPDERLKIIETGIQSTPNVKLVIIDGFVDVINDYMEGKEAHLTMALILSWCSIYNIHIAGVLHQNKADKNARAHIGTVASQKCEIEISAEVDKSDKHRSIINCVNSRGIPFEDFAIRWDKGSLPRIESGWRDTNMAIAEAILDHKHQSKKEVAEAVFKPFTALKHTQAVHDIMEAEAVGKDTAKRRIREFVNLGLISKGDDELYRISIK